MRIVGILSVFFSALLLNCASSQKIGEGEKLSIEREPAAKIEPGVYRGIAKVTGELFLYSGDGEDKKLVPFPSGEVSIELSKPSFFDFSRNRQDRVVSFATKDHKFNFQVPKELNFEDGKISVRNDFAEQNAHLTFEENISQVSEEKTEKLVNCKYQGICNQCRFSSKTSDYTCDIRQSFSCPGTQKVRFNLQETERALRIQIYNDSARAEIITKSKVEKSEIRDKILTDCAP